MPMRMSAIALLLVACSPGKLHYSASLSSRADRVACKDQPCAAWTAGRVDPVGGPGSQGHVVFVGDTGTRDVATRGVGAQAVIDAAKAVCGTDKCNAVVLLGDNIYERGLQDDTAETYFAGYLDAWDFVEARYVALGNHDYKPQQASLKRARAMLDFLRTKHGSHGDAHFWSTQVHGVPLAAIDTNYLVHNCRRGVSPAPTRFRANRPACRGSGGDKQGLRPHRLVDQMVPRGSNGILVGHHPWHSIGEHGNAGIYKDFGPISLGDGIAVRELLEYADNRAALYVSGHDHATMVHRSRQSLDVVVGASAKLTGPHPKTHDGQKRGTSLEMAAFCELGFAIAEIENAAIDAVQVYTLDAPTGTEGQKSCVKGLDTWKKGLTQEQVVRQMRPGADFGDLRCLRWEHDGREWLAPTTCLDLSLTP